MSAARAVILDFNGTLADDEALLIGIYEELLREHGVAFDAGQYPRYAGLSDREMFARLFQDHGRPLEAAATDRLLRARVGRYRSAVSEGHPVADETAAFVRALAAQVPVGIASAPSGRRSSTSWRLAGLAELVSVIVSIDEVRAGKPDPESFVAALVHINRDRCLAGRGGADGRDRGRDRWRPRRTRRRDALRRHTGRAYDEASGMADSSWTA